MKHEADGDAESAGEPRRPAVAELPTIEECRRLEPSLRACLEQLDQEVRGAHDRILADVDRSLADSALFLRGSATVIVTIAAGLMELAAERTRERRDDASFTAGGSGRSALGEEPQSAEGKRALSLTQSAHAPH
jgi:hypothetical protein